MVVAAVTCAASEGVDLTAKALLEYRRTHYAEAEAMYRQALDAFDRAGKGGGLDRAVVLENIAVMLRAQGRYTESEKLHREALPRIEELAGPDSVVTLRAVSNLAAVYMSCGKLEEA
jgi:tetratricopeptide (TPR) repeat protein